MKTPISDLPEEALNDILNGTDERLQLKTDMQSTYNYFRTYEGLVKYIELQQSDDAGSKARNGADSFIPEQHVLNVEVDDLTVKHCIFC